MSRTPTDFDKAPVDAVEGVETDPRWKLVERVAASPAFQRSKRVRDFLLFISERALLRPELPIREPEIRKAVFGRSADPNDPEDTLVRVQASQLRKRLLAYFATEGADEPMIIEVPKGTYTPMFKERRRELPVEPASAAVIGGSAPRPSRTALAATAAAFALLLALAVGLLFDNLRLRRTHVSDPLHLQPSVERLWRQIFGTGRVYAVLADGNLTTFQDLLKYQLTLPEYQRQRFQGAATEKIADKTTREFAVQLMYREFTGIADTNLARRVVTVNALQGRHTDIVLARYADAGQFRSQNVIVSGSRRANPWLELFEPRLNFRSRFEEDGRRAYLDNMSPAVGEEATYKVVWNHVGYCRVAYLSNLDGNGSVLIVSGSDMTSSDAGSEFITNERWVQTLLTRLDVGPDQPVPHFEVLLRTQLLLGSAPNFDVVAHRIHD